MGIVEAGGRQLVALEDVARHYRRPSICDIKVGFRTWYPSGDAAYIQRCQLKDAATTQATLGFKVCGMQARPHPPAPTSQRSLPDQPSTQAVAGGALATWGAKSAATPGLPD